MTSTHKKIVDLLTDRGVIDQIEVTDSATVLEGPDGDLMIFGAREREGNTIFIERADPDSDLAASSNEEFTAYIMHDNGNYIVVDIAYSRPIGYSNAQILSDYPSMTLEQLATL